MYEVMAGLTGESDWLLLALAAAAGLLATLVSSGLFQRAPAVRAGRSADTRPQPADSDDKLHERNVRLDAALNNMTQGLCMFDADERVVVLNRRFLEMYQLSPTVVRPGCTLLEVLRHRREVGLIEADPELYYADLKRSLAGGPAQLTLKTRDGRYILAQNQPMPGGGWVTTHEDVTERHKAEELVNEQKLQLDVALDNMSQGLCMFDNDTRLVFRNDRYLQMYDMSPDDVRPGMTLLELLELRISRGNFSRDPRDYLAELRKQILAGNSVTLNTELPDGRVIQVDNRPLPGGRWVSCHDDITVKRRAEERLQEQKLQLDTALKNMSQGLCMFDADGRIVVFNPRYAEIMNVSQEFLVGRTFLELMRHRKAAGDYFGDPDALNASLLKAMREGKGETKIAERGDGRVVQIALQPMPTGGWVATLEDITERRIAQERLREQKLQLDAALGNMTQGLCMFNAEGRVLLFNPRYAAIVGIAPDTLRNLAYRDLLRIRKDRGEFAGDPDQFSAEVLSGAREGRSLTRVVQQKNGRVDRIVLQPMANGGWVSTIEDITEQRRAEELLAKQKLQLDTALNNMSQGLNMFDAEGRLVVLNERYLTMYGLSAADVKPGCTVRDLVQARIANGSFFSTDPERYTAQLLQGMTKREQTRTEMEIPDGRVIGIVSQPTPDGSGWVVTHEDITERRRAEKERDRSQAFVSTVIENVPATIVVKDARTLRYVLVNRAGEAYFGAQRETMIGKTADEIFSPETAALIAQHDHALLRSGRTQFYDEHPTTTPGAGPRIVATTRTPIRDQHGELAYLLTVIEDRTNRKRAEAQIAHMAHHDALTGLPNRAAFNACLVSTIETTAREGSSFALMSLDVDRFKEINDVFGHVIGDDLLCELSRRLQRIAGGAFVARPGGDEFVIISTDGEQPAAAEALANQILAAAAEEFQIDSHHLRTSISVGVSIFPADGSEAETLIANADAALYRAKSEGRGMHRFFEAGMDKSLRERRVLQQELQSAIERGELMLNYQPQARMGGDIIGFEALVRWQHPTRGLIPPGDFIPLAEESGLIVPMGEWILREACREAASWNKPLQIGINLSPVQFRHGDLPAMVHSVLIETGLAPSRLELEITEGVLIGDFSRAQSILRRLKTLGVRIAMDDFGTGYSSMSYLQAFPFDKIKIDKAFISNLETSPQSAAIIRAVIGLARGLNLPVLAEGVETQAQLDFLIKESCDEIQGYLIGRPLPIADYAELTGMPPKARKPHALAS